MNTTQTQTTLAPLVAFLAGLLAGKGVFGFDTATWTYIIGGVAGIGLPHSAGSISANSSPILCQGSGNPDQSTSAFIDRSSFD